jgi:hypothetical protein
VKEKKTRDNYTRITQMLYPFSGLDKLDADVVAYAAERGTKVHKICEAIISGLGEIGVDDETWGYVESFKKWWSLSHDVVMMEQRFWDDENEITGQVDLIINTLNGLAVVDLKTSSRPSKTWPAQGAAYAFLARKANYDIKKIYFLHLNKHGKEPKIYEYDVNDSFFLSILIVWEHFFKKE